MTPLRSAWRMVVVSIATIVGSTGALVYSQHQASKLDENAISIATNASPAIGHLTAALGELVRIQIRANHVLRRTGTPVELAAFDHSLERLDAEFAAYRAIPFYVGEDVPDADAEASLRDVEMAVDALLVRVREEDWPAAELALVDGLAPALARADTAIEQLIVFNIKQQVALGGDIPRMRDGAARLGYVFDGVTALFGTALMVLVMRGARQHARFLDEQRRLAERREVDLTSFSSTLQSIIRSTARIADNIAHTARLEPMLRAIAEEARAITSADSCAIGCGDDAERAFDPWVLVGTDAPVEDAPRPIGLLADVMRASRPVRIADVAKDPTFLGFGAHHPELGPFLGVSIRHAGRTVATLYLARRAGAPEFREDDARATELLAAHVGIAIDNARLFNEAQAATRAREDLLAVVSHDLKSPLSTIRLSTELLSKTVTGTAGELTSRIGRATARMTDLIKDLLQAATIEAGHFTVAAQAQRVAQLLSEASDLFTLAAAERHVRIAWKSAPALVVWGERALLLRVFANLIGNALKFTPAEGSITLAAEPSGDLIHFSVKDTGSGIPAEHLPHLFERYWQERDGDRRGSGLGLFIVKGIVEAHGGTIWAESVLGEGTTIHFTARAARDEQGNGSA